MSSTERTLSWTVAMLSVLLLNGAALLGDYGYADDYAFLSEAASAETWRWGVFDGFGRFAQGYLNYWAFAAAGSVEGLAWLRALSAALTAACLTLAYAALRARLLGPTGAALTVLALASSPPFQIQVAWAALWTSPLTILIAFAAWRLARPAAEGRPGRRAWGGTAAAVAALVGALFIYQPAALFFCVWALIDALGRPRGDALRRGVVYGLVQILAMVAYMAAFQAFFEPNARVTLQIELASKLNFAVHVVAATAFKAHLMLAPKAVAALVAAAVVVAAFLTAPRREDRLVHGAVALFFLGLAFAPNVAADVNGAFRTQAAPMSCIVALLAYGAAAFAKRRGCAAWFAQSLAAAAVGVVACVGVGATARYFVWPQALEYAFVKAELRAAPDWSRLVLIKRPFGFFASVGAMEYGHPTSSLPSAWSMDLGFVQMAAQGAVGRVPKPADIVVVEADAADGALRDSGAAIMDMRRLDSFAP